MIHARIEPAFESWRDAARRLLGAGILPEHVAWDDGSGVAPLFAEPLPGEPLEAIRLPREFVEQARHAGAHRDPKRWGVLYRVAYRIHRGEARLMADELDDDVAAIAALVRQVRRDIHKMHAFVRFNRVQDEGGERYVAWYRPDHRIVQLAAPFFADRFRTMRWSILTADETAHFDDGELTFAPGVPENPALEDDVEALWRGYYGSIFNPARVNLRMMRGEMPVRYWQQMPETRDVMRLLEAAPARVEQMVAAQRGRRNAAAYVPQDASVAELAAALPSCEGCELFRDAIHAVPGRGPQDARLVLVGEQPGDEEDRSGEPFIGPAGVLLDGALTEAGLDRSALYVTNSVKHFAHTERGKWRIHRTPKASEVTACKPWLAAELRSVDPVLVVALGATAARALAGAQFRLLEERGRIVTLRDGRKMIATLHPAAVLRADGEVAAQYYAWLVNDLRVAKRECGL